MEKYVVFTDSGTQYIIEKKGIFAGRWHALRTNPRLWQQEKIIFTFTDDKTLIMEHKEEPRLTLNKLKKYSTLNKPRQGCSMLFSEGSSTRIRSIYPIRKAA